MHKIYQTFIICILTLATTWSVSAKDLKNAPNSIVVMQELKKKKNVLMSTFCPVNSDAQFTIKCKKEFSYKFNKGHTNPNVDIIEANGKTFFVQWVQPKARGRFVFVSGFWNGKGIVIKEGSFEVNMAPGKVFFMPLESIYNTKSRTQLAPEIKAAREVFIRHYGASVKSMKFDVTKAVKVYCEKTKNILSNGSGNCKIL